MPSYPSQRIRPLTVVSLSDIEESHWISSVIIYVWTVVFRMVVYPSIIMPLAESDDESVVLFWIIGWSDPPPPQFVARADCCMFIWTLTENTPRCLMSNILWRDSTATSLESWDENNLSRNALTSENKPLFYPRRRVAPLCVTTASFMNFNKASLGDGIFYSMVFVCVVLSLSSCSVSMWP